MSLVLLLCTLLQAGATKPSTSPQPSTSTSAPTTISAEIAEAIKQIVAKVTAWGERARICEARLNDDMASVRDIQGRQTDAKNQIVGFQKDLADANARAAASRGQQPGLGDAQRAAVLARTQIGNTQARLIQLNGDEQRYKDDGAKQQTCIDQAHTALATFINPSKAQTK
jgi:hypothetical protein